MEFVSGFQALVRNVAVAFDRPGKERSKCPRCKGSGLLAQRRMPWDWNQTTLSNDPCWFCEGLGVMPVAGLNGFFLGRASSAFHTRDIKASSQLPIKVQLYLGKYPGTRPKFVTHKPCDNPNLLLHDFSKLPDWLSGEDLPHLDIPAAQKNAVVGGGGGGQRERADRSPRTTTPASGTRRESSTLFRTKTSSRSPGSGIVVPRFSRQLGAASSATPRSPPPVPGTSARSASSSPKERQQAPVPVPVSPDLKPTLQISEQEATSTAAAAAASPRFVRFSRKSPKHFKAPRRERNRIREEAEKMAVERARRKQAVPVAAAEMDQQPDQQSGAAAPSSALRSLGNLSAEPSSSWAWASKLPLPPWLEPLKRPNHSWVNQMVYGSLKDRTAPLSPMPGKAFL